MRLQRVPSAVSDERSFSSAVVAEGGSGFKRYPGDGPACAELMPIDILVSGRDALASWPSQSKGGGYMARTFSILGEEIAFSDQQIAYIELRKTYLALNAELIKVISPEIASSLPDPEYLGRKIFTSITICMGATSDISVINLCNNGVFYVDEKQFFHDLRISAETDEFCDPIQSIWGALRDDESIRGKERRAAADTLRSPQNFDRLINAFSRLIELGLQQTATIIASTDSRKLEFPASEDVKQARSIFSNLSNGRVPEDHKKEILLQAVRKNPYDPTGHVLVASLFPTLNDGEELAKFLNIGVHQNAGIEQDKGLISEYLCNVRERLRLGIRP
jgi:hypothetical protein